MRDFVALKSLSSPEAISNKVQDKMISQKRSSGLKKVKPCLARCLQVRCRLKHLNIE
jgi:hypothetical protein